MKKQLQQATVRGDVSGRGPLKPLVVPAPFESRRAVPGTQSWAGVRKRVLAGEETEPERERERDRKTQRDTERKRKREKDREAQRGTERHSEAQRGTERERERAPRPRARPGSRRVKRRGLSTEEEYRLKALVHAKMCDPVRPHLFGTRRLDYKCTG